MPVAIALFTRDLRVRDNPVLWAAARADSVVPLFVLDDGCRDFLRPNRAAFLVDCLDDLREQLRGRGSDLVVQGALVDQVRQVADETGAEQVHVAADVSAYAQRREDRLERMLRRRGRELLVHDASVTAVPPGGESAGRRRLDGWAKRVDRYDDGQDRLDEDGTSRLSPYLHSGCLSTTQVIHRIGAGSAGAQALVRQVAWRDFHHQVLAARPASSRRDYRGHGDRWRSDPAAFEAWRDGRTGYPIVDAAMRQLLTEGWMHNRARLLVGSFLTKTLYLGWRLGGQHFPDHLVDGHVADNQMNWQWVAGTGTDTRPHQVLNPIAQAHRHDPDGDYARRYVPELAGIERAAVHEPWRLAHDTRKALSYPDRIVDLNEGLHRFRAARGRE